MQNKRNFSIHKGPSKEGNEEKGPKIRKSDDK
jgi:hypothetical protein